MPYIEDFSEFKARMDCEHIIIDGVALFANGANSDRRLSHNDPPTDPITLALAKFKFLTARLNDLHLQLQRVQALISTQLEYFTYDVGPDPDQAFPGWEKEVERLEKAIRKAQKEREKISATLPQRVAHRAHAEAQAKRLAQAKTIRERLREVLP